MSARQVPGTVAGIRTVREAFGHNMYGLVPPDGLHIMEDGWWIALTGAPDPSYNLALVYDGNVRKNASEVLERVLAEETRSVIMLAGVGLNAATVMADAGWVCVASSPLRAMPNIPWEADSSVKVLDGAELSGARELAGDVFGVDLASAELVYSSKYTDGRVERLVLGLIEDGDLQTAAMLSFGQPISTAWAGGTRTTGRRKGHGLRVVRQVARTAYSEVGEGSVCFLGSDVGNGLYDAAGAEIIEYWQMWSRPRWLLGN